VVRAVQEVSSEILALQELPEVQQVVLVVREVSSEILALQELPEVQQVVLEKAQAAVEVVQTVVMVAEVAKATAAKLAEEAAVGVAALEVQLVVLAELEVSEILDHQELLGVQQEEELEVEPRKDR
jgi:hypothetical protein